MRCIAIDDEPIALSILTEYCRKIGDIELETFTNPLEGMKRIRESIPDLVFLDIEMNGVSGIELARELPKECCLIFTTAFAQYALDGFEVNALDFLHKPFFYYRFEKAMEKANEWIGMKRTISQTNASERKITLTIDYKKTAIAIDEILYIEAMENYCKLYRIDKPMLISQIALKNLMTLLPENEFVRIHRSFVVSVAKIARYNRHEIILLNEKRLIVGRKFQSELFMRM